MTLLTRGKSWPSRNVFEKFQENGRTRSSMTASFTNNRLKATVCVKTPLDTIQPHAKFQSS